MKADDALKELVKAAVLLAIVRNNLDTEDCDVNGDEDEIARIAADAWNALNGIETCADEPCKELLAVRLRLSKPCMAEALQLCQRGKRVRPCIWRTLNAGHWIEFGGGHFIEHGTMEEIPHALRLSLPEEFFGPWEVVELDESRNIKE